MQYWSPNYHLSVQRSIVGRPWLTILIICLNLYWIREVWKMFYLEIKLSPITMKWMHCINCTNSHVIWLSGLWVNVQMCCACAMFAWSKSLQTDWIIWTSNQIQLFAICYAFKFYCHWKQMSVIIQMRTENICFVLKQWIFELVLSSHAHDAERVRENR